MTQWWWWRRHEEEDFSSHGWEEKDSNTNKKMTLILQNFKRFMNHERQQEWQSKNEGKLFTPMLFQCGKKGYIRPNFPYNQKRNQNHKKSKKPLKEDNVLCINSDENDMDSSYE